jgi:hypothetical protein
MIVILAFHSVSMAAPPLFNPLGEERILNSCIFVQEGREISFQVSAVDPDGDSLVYSAENVPGWADFDSSTGIFKGIAPVWPSEYEQKRNRPGVFDVYFSVTDGVYTVHKVVSIYVLDARWTSKTMAELVDSRPIKAGGAIGTPVKLENVKEEIITSSFGGGRHIKKITFGFTSQVPDVSGWENDWVARTNYAFLPLDGPAVTNAGAVIEGGYSRRFGETFFAERACAELGIPVLIIDMDWETTHGGDVMSKHNEQSISTGNPEYLFSVFSAAHYLRASDALVTVIKRYTDWDVSYENFKTVFTGHSKFGHTCFKAAAARPERVAGFMAAGIGGLDTGAARLLGILQGADTMNPGASPTYLGAMIRYFTENIRMEDQMASDLHALVVQGTNDSKGKTEGYGPKYSMLATEMEINMPYATGSIPNVPHTTRTPQHSDYWIMWLAHTLLNRPLTDITGVSHHAGNRGITVEAMISGRPSLRETRVWATSQSDTDTGQWDNFIPYPMALEEGVYRGEIPADSTAYFVEVLDEAMGVKGIVTSSPRPVNRDYPLLPQPPENAWEFTVKLVGDDVGMDWLNPSDLDFRGSLIRSDTAGYPSVSTGAAVYDGSGNHAVQVADSENTYYSIFTYDATGGYSSGAYARVCLPGKEEPPVFDNSTKILHMPEVMVGGKSYSVDLLCEGGMFRIIKAGPPLCAGERAFFDFDTLSLHIPGLHADGILYDLYMKYAGDMKFEAHELPFCP